MNQSELVSKLIRPFCELEATVSPKDVVMAALTWPSQGWMVEALDWLDQGGLIDDEIARSLEWVAGRKHYLQSTRHRAFALAKRWRRAQACEQPFARQSGQSAAQQMP